MHLARPGRSTEVRRDSHWLGRDQQAMQLAGSLEGNEAVPRVRKPSKKPLQVFYGHLLSYSG